MSGPQEHPGLSDLLQLVDPAGRRDRSKAVFANRSLRMDRIEVIGFDMDYTLAMYNKEAIEGLAISTTIDKLIARGYPASLRSIEYDCEFAIRGLVVDKRHGNLFKMDRHRHVRRAFHGFQPLDKAARRRVYRSETIRLSAPRYHLIDTLFALPEAYLYDMATLPHQVKGDFRRLFPRAVPAEETPEERENDDWLEKRGGQMI